MKQNKNQSSSVLDTVYEIILLSPVWGIAVVYGWREISKFIENL